MGWNEKESRILRKIGRKNFRKMKKFLMKGRIAYFGKKADTHFWSGIWNELSFQQKYYEAKNNKILNRAFSKYLNNNFKIIEAGCGLGQWVYVLSEKGINIVGVDYCKDIVDKIVEHLNINLKYGDVLHLDFPSNEFDCYISIGVAEHFKEGPQLLLKEAKRVLKPGGVIFISIPYINPFRRLKKFLRIYKKQKDGPNSDLFYQYVFTKKEFGNLLKQNDFSILESIPLYALQGLADEFLFSWKGTYKKGSKRGSMKSFFKSIKTLETKIMRTIFAHMILFVAKKAK